MSKQNFIPERSISGMAAKKVGKSECFMRQICELLQDDICVQRPASSGD
jgi:hypothetical protein